MSLAPALRLTLALLLSPAVAASADLLRITWHPPVLSVGQVAWLHVRGVSEAATVEGMALGRPLRFFPYAGGQAAVVGFDLEDRPGTNPWRLAVIEPGQAPRTLAGQVRLRERRFPVQRLTLPTAMVDLSPEVEQRAVAESHQLRTLFRVVTRERLWRGKFVRPVAGTEPGSGFGSRRIINNQPRSPHSGVDYPAPQGTPVVAANDGRVALVADFFFPGRLAVIDHGLGLYTLYFHLADVSVSGGERVVRGQPIGTVGATGRATGPHLHFGVQVGSARVDPATLLDLGVGD